MSLPALLVMMTLSTVDVLVSSTCKERMRMQDGLTPSEARIYFLCSSKCAVNCGMELFLESVCTDIWVRQPKMAAMTQKGCKIFSNRFREFRGLGIKGHNNKGYYQKSVQKCRQLCVRSFTFYCRSFEYQHHGSPKLKNCYLSATMYMTVPVRMRDHGLPGGWSYMSRLCKKY